MGEKTKKRSWIELKLFPFFCMHDFIESETKRTIFCPKCGRIKVIPCPHKWVSKSESYEGSQRNEKGDICKWLRRWAHLECKICGDHKRVET